MLKGVIVKRSFLFLALQRQVVDTVMRPTAVVETGEDFKWRGYLVDQ